MEKNLFAKAANLNAVATERWYASIMSAMDEFNITDLMAQAMFIAQTGHESEGFSKVIENLNYSPLGLQANFGKHRFPDEVAFILGRNHFGPAKVEEIAERAYFGRLGNNTPGDGWKFRGRGLVQITGRDNYERCGAALKVSLLEEPHLLESELFSARSAAWYWDWKKCNITCADIQITTEKINGLAKAGLSDRIKRFNRACEVLKAY